MWSRAWSRGELLGRLAVKCFVDDNYTYQQCVPAWWLAAGGAGAEEKVKQWQCGYIQGPGYLDYLEHCNNVNTPLSPSPVSPPPHSLTTLSFPWLAGRVEGGYAVPSGRCTAPAPSTRPPPRSGALERRKSSLHYDRVKVEYWCHRSPPPEQSLALSSAPLFGEPE